MDDNPAQKLLRCDRESYGDSFTSDLLEQYKLYVQSAENVSTRRIASSRYLLTLNAASSRCMGFSPPGSGRAIGRCWFPS